MTKRRQELGKIVPYTGGKRHLAPEILPILPKHKKYLELFAGGAAIYFEKPAARENVLNDIDSGMIGFYDNFSCNALKPCKKIKDVCGYTKKAKERVVKGSKNVCDNLAARRFTIVAGVKTGIKWDECAARPIVSKDLEKNCKDYEKKLRRAKLENMDFRQAFKKHDAKGVLTYMDPPYLGTFHPYRSDKKTVQPKDVCDLARGAKGKVIISYGDTPLVRSACTGRGLHVKTIKAQHRSAHVTKSSSRRREVLITNFKVKRRR